MKFYFIIILINLFSLTNISAKEVKNTDLNSLKIVKNFHDWNLYQESRKGESHCYLVSTPIESTSQINLKKRGEPYFMITDIKNDVSEISVSSGVSYYPNDDIEISFNSAKFYLFFHRYLAWAKDKNDDIEIVKAMQRENEFVVKAVSKNNKIIYDKYSLIGFVDAFRFMKEFCKN